MRDDEPANAGERDHDSHRGCVSSEVAARANLSAVARGGADDANGQREKRQLRVPDPPGRDERVRRTVGVRART